MTNPRALDEINRNMLPKEEADEMPLHAVQKEIHEYFFLGDPRPKFVRASRKLAIAYKEASAEEVERSRGVQVFTRTYRTGRKIKIWLTRDAKGRFKRILQSSEAS